MAHRPKSAHVWAFVLATCALVGGTLQTGLFWYGTAPLNHDPLIEAASVPLSWFHLAVRMCWLVVAVVEISSRSIGSWLSFAAKLCAWTSAWLYVHKCKLSKNSDIAEREGTIGHVHYCKASYWKVLNVHFTLRETINTPVRIVINVIWLM